MINDNNLCHYGVLGMKWGRRKSSQSIASKKFEAGKQSAADNKASGKKMTARQAAIDAKRARLKAGRQTIGQRLKEGRSGSLREVNQKIDRYDAETKLKRADMKGAAKFKQKMKDEWNRPCKSITWKDSTYGKEKVKAFIAGAAGITVGAYLVNR